MLARHDVRQPLDFVEVLVLVVNAIALEYSQDTHFGANASERTGSHLEEVCREFGVLLVDQLEEEMHIDLHTGIEHDAGSEESNVVQGTG